MGSGGHFCIVFGSRMSSPAERLHRAPAFLVGAALSVALFAQSLHAQALIVQVEGLRSDLGTVRVGFYDSPEQWASKRSNFQRHGAKRGLPAGGGTLVLRYEDVPPGRYGIAIADDENDNGGMDWGVLLPKEGFGFSNYYSTRLRRPDFEEFAFTHSADGDTVVTVRVRYL